jgi:hypothetical protein
VPEERAAVADDHRGEHGQRDHSDALVAADIAHVAWAVNLGCLGFHVWPLRADDPDHADELRIDLDPSPARTSTTARAAAKELRDLLEELGLTGYPKTTGKRGIHVYVRLQPRWDSYEVRAAAVAVARELERRRPDLLTAAWWKEERGDARLRRLQPERPAQDRVRGVVRAGAPRRAGVDPVRLGRARRRRPGRAHHRDRAGRVADGRRPVGGMYDEPQSLEPLLALHERDMEAGLMDAPWPPVYPKMPNEPPRVAPSRGAGGGIDEPRSRGGRGRSAS